MLETIHERWFRPLLSLVMASERRLSRKACISTLDRTFYAEAHSSIAPSEAAAETFFRYSGFELNDPPSSWFSEAYLYSALHQQTLSDQKLIRSYVNSGLSEKPRLVFVSHDASRTGAPAIILRLLELFSESGAFECFTILDNGGERLKEFEARSHTHVMSRGRYDPTMSEGEAFAELANLFGGAGVFERNKPVCALVNSVESNRIGRHLSQLGIPVIALIHEIAAYYPTEVFAGFCDFSERIVFPSHFVHHAANRRAKIDPAKITVRGQGLLEDAFGTLDRESCRKQLRKELDLEDDAFVVLNVGTIDVRKGADLFVDLARLLFEKRAPSKPVYFLWFGFMGRPLDYVQSQIDQHNLSDRVRFLPATSEIEKIFMGGDLFCLTARGDPFPCVVHEALACGLPAIAFRNGGGAPELIGDQCGTIVDMAALSDAADAILTYIEDPSLLAEQSENAKREIADNWSFQRYCEDIYGLVQDCGHRPEGGWPKLEMNDPVEHLIVASGSRRIVPLVDEVCKRHDGEKLEVALIDGRFGEEIDQVVRALRRKGIAYRVHQPANDTTASRRDLLAKILVKPRPKRVTLINALRYTTSAMLEVLPYPKTAIEIEGSASVEQVEPSLLHLDEVRLDDPSRFRDIVDAEPRLADRVKML